MKKCEMRCWVLRVQFINKCRIYLRVRLFGSAINPEVSERSAQCETKQEHFAQYTYLLLVFYKRKCTTKNVN